MISYEIPDVVVAVEVSLTSAVVVVVVEGMMASNVDLAVEMMATTSVDVAEMTAVASFVVAETSFAVVVAAETSFAVVVAETSCAVAAAEQTYAAETFAEGFEPFVALADETSVAEIAEHDTFVVAEHTLDDDPVVDVMFEVVLVEMDPSFVAHACKVQIKKR